MLAAGYVLHVPVTKDGEDIVLTVLVDRVATGKDGALCRVRGDAGAIWLPALLLIAAVARAEITLDVGSPARPHTLIHTA